MSTNVNPVGVNPIYSAGVGSVNGASNAKFQQDLSNEIALRQAEDKVMFLADLLNVQDLTQEQKNVVQSMLNDANREYTALKQKLNVG